MPEGFQTVSQMPVLFCYQEDEAPPRPPLPQLYSPDDQPPAVPPLPREATVIRHTSVRGLKRQSDERKRDRELGQYVNGDYRVSAPTPPHLHLEVSEPVIRSIVVWKMYRPLGLVTRRELKWQRDRNRERALCHVITVERGLVIQNQSFRIRFKTIKTCRL